MRRHILVRPADATTEQVEQLRDYASTLGFSVQIQRRVGRSRVSSRPGFSEALQSVKEEVDGGRLSLRAGARRLGVGVATLHRLPRASRR